MIKKPPTLKPLEFAIAIYFKYASTFLQRSWKFSIFKYFWQVFSPFKETELTQGGKKGSFMEAG